MKLVIIRHGESEWNKKNLFTGWSDVDLSDKGVEEAKNAGRTLKENNFDDDIRCSSWIKNRLSLFSWQPIFYMLFYCFKTFFAYNVFNSTGIFCCNFLINTKFNKPLR